MKTKSGTNDTPECSFHIIGISVRIVVLASNDDIRIVRLYFRMFFPFFFYLWFGLEKKVNHSESIFLSARLRAAYYDVKSRAAKE